MSGTISFKEFCEENFSKEFNEEADAEYERTVETGKVLKRVQEATKSAPEVEVAILWYDNWFNGPCDGVCGYNKERYFYTYVDDTLDDERIYAVVEIDSAILSEMNRRAHYYGLLESSKTEDQAKTLMKEISEWPEMDPWWGSWKVIGKFRASQVSWPVDSLSHSR